LPRKDQTLSIAAQAMLVLIEKQIGPTGARREYQNV
jgi:hypothetical protein